MRTLAHLCVTGPLKHSFWSAVYYEKTFSYTAKVYVNPFLNTANFLCAIWLCSVWLFKHSLYVEINNALWISLLLVFVEEVHNTVHINLWVGFHFRYLHECESCFAFGAVPILSQKSRPIMDQCCTMLYNSSQVTAEYLRSLDGRKYLIQDTLTSSMAKENKVKEYEEDVSRWNIHGKAFKKSLFTTNHEKNAKQSNLTRFVYIQ